MVTKDYKYEHDEGLIFLIRAMEFIDETNIAGKEPTGDIDIPFHVKIQKNKNEFGIHPRFVLLARTFAGSGGNSCLVQKGVIYKKLPILTIDRFGIVTEWGDEDATNAPATAKITLAHKPDGTGTVEYVIVKKIEEYNV